MNSFQITDGLVDYSSDEESFSEIDCAQTSSNITAAYGENIPQNECTALPLPSEIKSMFGECTDLEESDVGKYEGKIRSFPHERGVWATYVYIDYKAEPEFLDMIKELQDVSQKHGVELSSLPDFHVSLSRTLKLRHHWIQPFIESLKVKLRHFFKFKIMFQSLEVYENEESTRTFVGLKVHLGFENLSKITEKVDSCLSEFHLPLYYAKPSFHLSCASCVGSKAKEIEAFMPDINAVFQSFIEVFPATRTLMVTDIYCKSGNKLFKIPLK